MNSVKNILYIHHQGNIGGAERSLVNLLRGLDRGRFSPFFAGEPQGALREHIDKLQIPSFGLAFKGLKYAGTLLYNAFRLVLIIKARKIDLIHSNAPQTNIAAGIAARISRIPVIWHARNILEPGMIDWDRIFSVLATRIVCNSQAIRDRFIPASDYSRKTSVIINGVNIEEFSPTIISAITARQQLGLSKHIPVIGVFDRLDPRKDHETVLRGFARLHSVLPDSILLITGKAFSHHEERKAVLEKLAAQLGIDDAIRFLGFRKDIPTIMTACDLIVLASRHEGCSRTLCEAQAMGRPVVASNDGGNPELLDDGKTGFLFPVGDYQNLAQHMLHLLTNHMIRLEMGTAARYKAEKDLSIQRYCNQVMGVYEELFTIR